MVRNAYTLDPAFDDDLALVGHQLNPSRGEVLWYRVGAYLTTAVVVSAIWFLKIAPEDKSPNSLMVEPATAALESFVQPATDMPTLSAQVGFTVHMPDLKKLGIETVAVGESEFIGHPAAVAEYQQGNAVYLMYSFRDSHNLLCEMRQVDSADHKFYVTSGGAVSVVAWQDKTSGYHALAAKTTEQELLALAVVVDKLS